MKTDVVVVGAGLSGLACARALRAAGASVRVLEARDRVGGRTLSRRIGGGTFDLGGQWLGAGQARLSKLANDLELETFATYETGKKVLAAGGGPPSTYAGTIPTMNPFALIDLQQALMRAERAAKRVPGGAPLDAVDAQALDARTLDEWMRRTMVSARAREVFAAAIRVIFGAEPRELSLLWVLHYVNAAGGLMRLVEIQRGAQETRFVDGAQSISTRLAGALGDDVRLEAPVRSIEERDGGVRVTSDRGAFDARFVVVATPPALASRIAFDRPLPAPRDQLLQRFGMGATVKCLAFYERAFWRERGLSGEAVFTRGDVSVIFDNGSHDGAQPCLLAFVVGDPARRWSTRPEAERRAAVLDAMVRALGPEASQPTEYVEQDWQTEPWSRGCPVGNVGPGALSAAGAEALREPCGRVHWAGTETASSWAGFLEGAIEAGERAASEVLAR